MAQQKRRKSTRTKSSSSRSNAKTNAQRKEELKLKMEIAIVVTFALCVLLFLCNFGIIGTVGDFLSSILFGLLGVMSYVFPIFLFVIVLVKIVNAKSSRLLVKNIFAIIGFVSLCIICEIISGYYKAVEKINISEVYSHFSESRNGGGLIGASLAIGLTKLIGITGTVFVLVVLLLVSIILITGKSLFKKFSEQGERINEKSHENKVLKEEIYKEREDERERKRKIKEERLIKREEIAQRHKEEQIAVKEAKATAKTEAKEAKEDEKILRTSRKLEGVTYDTLIVKRNQEKNTDDIHEIVLNGFNPNTVEFVPPKEAEKQPVKRNLSLINEDDVSEITSSTQTEKVSEKPALREAEKTQKETTIVTNPDKPIKTGVYKFPPMDLLTLNTVKSNKGGENISETAKKLEETLAIYGVKAEVVDVSQGPTVTRYELQPELGTKVSRIKSLSDDIKLNMATSDIRIEAPIPGKAAVGIEMPNKEPIPVLLRDLIDTNVFSKFNSNLSFAVGKDIAGKVVVYDVDQFPHLLIAGTTGSGKSVCINTLIISILYKAHPNDVKLIMIDPKVVELSVYNGIPHLMIPVVTDPKKAAAALNWATVEMDERYKKFSDLNVRDLKGYNYAVAERTKNGEESELYKPMPQIVIIVDELADLMMVAKGDVEEAICRLAQKARACGIHLVIATQRPSVDVITGLIKANMPSRIAFAVSSGVDSRTILDMSGAEELLGKGDMLFFPKGLKKPVRLQGAYVSDGEVSDIVDFLKMQNVSTETNDVMDKINAMHQTSGSFSEEGSEQAEFDEYFMDAAKFIIQSDKASSGMLQRKYKIGFNRAGRIIDKLAEIGVVSGDNGTKARKVLMTLEEFENYVEENGL